MALNGVDRVVPPELSGAGPDVLAVDVGGTDMKSQVVDGNGDFHGLMRFRARMTNDVPESLWLSGWLNSRVLAEVGR